MFHVDSTRTRQPIDATKRNTSMSSTLACGRTAMCWPACHGRCGAVRFVAPIDRGPRGPLVVVCGLGYGSVVHEALLYQRRARLDPRQELRALRASLCRLPRVPYTRVLAPHTLRHIRPECTRATHTTPSNAAIYAAMRTKRRHVQLGCRWVKLRFDVDGRQRKVVGGGLQRSGG
jgi:hypothetical protein